MAIRRNQTGESLVANVLLTLWICFAAIVIGGLAHLLVGGGRPLVYVYVVIAGIGTAGYFTLRLSIRTAKSRNLAFAVSLALLFSITCYVSMYFFNYLQFRNEVVDSIVKKQDSRSSLNRDSAELMLDERLDEETGSKGFLGFIKYSAQEGFEWGAARFVSPQLVSGIGAYTYWGLEFVAIFLFSLYGARTAHIPICYKCKTFYVDYVLAKTSIGSVDSIEDALESGNYSSIAGLLESAAGTLYAMLLGARCPKCESSKPTVKIQSVTLGNDGEERTKLLYEKAIRYSDFRIIADSIFEAEGDK